MMGLMAELVPRQVASWLCPHLGRPLLVFQKDREEWGGSSLAFTKPCLLSPHHLSLSWWSIHIISELWVEAEESEVRGHSGLHSKLQATPRETLFPKKKKRREGKEKKN